MPDYLEQLERRSRSDPRRTAWRRRCASGHGLARVSIRSWESSGHWDSATRSPSRARTRLRRSAHTFGNDVCRTRRSDAMQRALDLVAPDPAYVAPNGERPPRGGRAIMTSSAPSLHADRRWQMVEQQIEAAASARRSCWRRWARCGARATCLPTSGSAHRATMLERRREPTTESTESTEKHKREEWASGLQPPSCRQECGDCHQATRLRESDLGCPSAN
jgi:hypothetical protein